MRIDHVRLQGIYFHARRTGNLAVVLPLDEFRAGFEQLTGTLMEKILPPHSIFLVLGCEALGWLQRTWRALLRRPRRAGSVKQHLIESIAHVCVSTEVRPDATHRHSRLVFRKAMDRCLDGTEPASPACLALDLGVSLRSLEMAFHACVDMPPARDLRWVRLNRAHAMLSRHAPDETTVTRVAIDLGFGELGRFAVEYRLMFGERSSETLRRGSSQRKAHLPRVI